MKLVYVANIRIPTEKAHGAQIMKMCESLTQAGAEVSLVAPKRKNIIKDDPFEYYQTEKIFSLKKLPTLDPQFFHYFPAGYYIKFQSLFFLISLFLYLLFSKDKKFSIYYTRDEMLLSILQLFSRRVIWEVHALPKNTQRYIKSWKKCYKIFCLTQKIKNELIGFGIAENRIIISPDAVDLKIFDISENRQQAREKLHLPDDKIIIGYTGSFKTKGMDKGIADILKALAIVSKDRNDLIFYAVGGSLLDINYYKKIAEQNGVLTKTYFIEKLPQKEVALYQKAFDFLLMPFPFNDHYAYYMSPLKMFEYLTAKRPIIASDLPSIREILDEKSCLFCQPDDPIDLAQKISLLINNSVLSEQLGENSYLLRKNYTWEKRAKNIIKMINN